MALVARKPIEIDIRQVKPDVFIARCDYLDISAAGTTGMTAVTNLFNQLGSAYRQFNSVKLQKKGQIGKLTRLGCKMKKRFNNVIMNTRPYSHARTWE